MFNLVEIAAYFAFVDINFNSRNVNFELLKSLLKQTNADVVCWQEFSPAAENWARKNLSDYPYSKQIPRRNNFGIAIFSKIPVSNFKVEYFTDLNIETIVATIQPGAKTFQIICTHTYPPIEFDALNTRDLQLKNLAAFVRKGGPPTILCGDLNTTSWSSSFKNLLRDSGLIDSRQGFGVQSSWPTCLAPMMIPIDHVLVDPHIKVLDRQIGPDVKSDHFPVIVKLAI
jgi:endonuclease/exonuclease/phosphatase (EEP) superfamily protein YafD